MHHAKLRVVGKTPINRVLHTVYEIDGRPGKWVLQDGKLVSMTGAKTFRVGQYPLHPSLASTERYLGGTAPLAVLDESARRDAAREILRDLAGRLVSLGMPQKAA